MRRKIGAKTEAQATTLPLDEWNSHGSLFYSIVLKETVLGPKNKVCFLKKMGWQS